VNKHRASQTALHNCFSMWCQCFSSDKFCQPKKGNVLEFYFSSVNWIKFVSFLELFPKNFITKVLEKNLSEIRWPGCMFLPLSFFPPFFFCPFLCFSCFESKSSIFLPLLRMDLLTYEKLFIVPTMGYYSK
jgi:hypothetical protein